MTTKVDNPDVIGPLGGYVIPRLCTKPVCNAVIAFLFFFAFLNAFSAMTRLGGVMLQLRCATWREGGREGGREGASERGSEGARERGSEGARERGRQAGRERERQRQRQRGEGRGRER